jgi:hypothetical protein
MSATADAALEGGERLLECAAHAGQVPVVDETAVELAAQLAQDVDPVGMPGPRRDGLGRWGDDDPLDDLDRGATRGGRATLLPRPVPAGRRAPLGYRAAGARRDRATAPPACRRRLPSPPCAWSASIGVADGDGSCSTAGRCDCWRRRRSRFRWRARYSLLPLLAMPRASEVTFRNSSPRFACAWMHQVCGLRIGLFSSRAESRWSKRSPREWRAGSSAVGELQRPRQPWRVGGTSSRKSPVALQFHRRASTVSRPPPNSQAPAGLPWTRWVAVSGRRCGLRGRPPPMRPS